MKKSGNIKDKGHVKKSRKTLVVLLIVLFVLVAICSVAIFSVYEENHQKKINTDAAAEIKKVAGEIKLLEKQRDDKNTSAQQQLDLAKSCTENNNKYLASCNAYSWIDQINQCRSEAVTLSKNCSDYANKAQDYADQAKETQYQIDRLNNK